MTLYTDKAEYREQVIPEYRGNPLIEALPDIWSGGQVIQIYCQRKQPIIIGRGNWICSTGCIVSIGYSGIFSHWSSTLISNSGYPEASARAIYIEIH